MSGSRFLHNLVFQGDYLCLGLAGVSEASIGLYYFAYRVATQTFSLIGVTIPSVLFPSLSQLVLNPELQLRATLRASRLLALVVFPFCMLQVLLAAPLIRLVCPPQWLGAVVPLQLLTFGMMLTCPVWPTNSLMMAQRRFHDLLRLAVVYVVTFFAAVGGALLVSRSIVSVAAAVCLWNTLINPYAFYVAVRPRLPIYGYFATFYRTFLAMLVPFVICSFLAGHFPPGRIGDVVTMLTVGIVFSVIYIGMLWLLAKQEFVDLLAQLVTLVRRQKDASAAPQA